MIAPRKKPVVVSSYFRAIVLSAATLVSVGGCAQQYATPEEAMAHACSALGPRALSGALIGGLGGAAGGAAIGGIAGGGRGAAIGAGIGLAAGLVAGTITGHTLDQADCREAQIALQEMGNAEVNQAVVWSNPTTGSHGQFTPISNDFIMDGRVCRHIRADYYMSRHEPVVGDQGVICRSSNGDWARVAAPAT